LYPSEKITSLMKGFSRILIVSLLLLVLPSGSMRAIGAEEIQGGEEFLEGRRLQSAGDWTGSIKRFRAAADVYSTVADYSLYQMAQSALQVGDTGVATASLEELFSLYPDSPVAPRARMELINLYFNTGERGKAVPYLETALRGTQSTRESASLSLMLAKAYQAAGDPSTADSILWRILYNWPETSEALDAVELVGEPDTPQKMLAVAKTYSLNKKSRKALDILEELMIDPRVGPMMPEILFHMALSFSQEGKKKASSDLYTEIISDYPTSSFAAAALFERAEYRRSMAIGMTGEALHDYAQLVEDFPKSPLAPQALRERAEIFEKLGSPDEYAEYEKLLESYSKYGLTLTAVMHWGVKLYQAGDYSGARRVFEKLEAADIGYDANADAAFWIAKCTMAGGNRNLAKSQLAGVIKRFDESHQGFRALPRR
jgi:TolA-binding protein